jgi:hypothetical protein
MALYLGGFAVDTVVGMALLGDSDNSNTLVYYVSLVSGVPHASKAELDLLGWLYALYGLLQTLGLLFVAISMVDANMYLRQGCGRCQGNDTGDFGAFGLRLSGSHRPIGHRPIGLCRDQRLTGKGQKSGA